MDEITKKVCPIRDGMCLGRDCALAIKRTTMVLPEYTAVWRCGLVNFDKPWAYTVVDADLAPRGKSMRMEF